MKRRALAALLCAGLALAIAPTAGATGVRKPAKKPGPIKTRTATQSATGHGAIVTATATCTGKTKAISGGFSVPPPGAGAGALPIVFESQKLGGKSWRASAQIVDLTNDTPTTVALTTYVYCRKNAPKISAVTAAAPAEPLPVIYGPSPTAACPAPLRAVAGGFGVTPQLPTPSPGYGFTALPFETYRIAPGIWRTGAVSGTGSDASVTTFAYCAKSKKAPKEATARGSAVTKTQEKSTVDARCAKGQPISGGLSDENAGLKTGAFYPYESRRLGTGWRVSGLAQGPGPLTLIAHAYCA